MIKANELRIGNWVTLNTDGGKPFQWTYKLMTEYSENDFLPIPLTPEILKKAGFVLAYEEANYYTKSGFYGDISITKNNVVLKDYEGNEVCEMEYLHQLQNLYFALTGEELEIFI